MYDCDCDARLLIDCECEEVSAAAAVLVTQGTASDSMAVWLVESEKYFVA